jgi:hypothetical protein
MPKTAIMAIEGGLDCTFCTAVIGLYCIAKGEMPTIINGYSLDSALNGNALEGVERIWSVGMDPTSEQIEKAKSRGIGIAVIASPTDEESGSRRIMESAIGRHLMAKGSYPNLVEVATLANVWCKRLLRTNEWSKARALNAALKAFGKCPWKKPDKFLVEWKMILSEPDALQILTDSGSAMCDWDDSVTQSEVNGNGGYIDFAGSRWICVNGRVGFLGGRDVRPPVDHDGVISWCWCPREGMWRITFLNEGKASIQEALSVCESRTKVAKSFQMKGQSAVAYMQDIPFPLGDIKYFWKFGK